MTRDVAIYLAGKIPKAHEHANETYWTEKDQEQLKVCLKPYNALLLNPAIRSDDLSDQHSVFGRDMLQVFSSDAVFVDARERRGLGVGAEMMWAKMQRIPVITLAPMGSHYNKESTYLLDVEVKKWLHPFVKGLSDYVAASLDQACTWLKNYMNEPHPSIKGPEWMHDAMEYYLATQFPLDTPMRNLAMSSSTLEKRLEKIHV